MNNVVQNRRCCQSINYDKYVVEHCICDHKTNNQEQGENNKNHSSSSSFLLKILRNSLPIWPINAPIIAGDNISKIIRIGRPIPPIISSNGKPIVLPPFKVNNQIIAYLSRIKTN